jgi:hypothetical protein
MRQAALRQTLSRWGVVLAAAALIPSAYAGHHDPVPVAPELEIEVLDPNVDPNGNPAVITRESEDGNELEVDIPPVVLVHRYYYTGDRKFQGPMLPGGPSIVVATHPKTGERLYIPVQMLPGAPEVTYTRKTITYDYGTQAITICFRLFGKTSVSIREGVPLTKRVHEASAKVRDGTKGLIQRTDLPEFAHAIVGGTKNAAVAAIDGANDLARVVINPAIQVIRVTPLANVFGNNPEQRATRERDKLVKRSAAESRLADAYIPTNQ